MLYLSIGRYSIGYSGVNFVKSDKGNLKEKFYCFLFVLKIYHTKFIPHVLENTENISVVLQKRGASLYIAPIAPVLKTSLAYIRK